MSDLDHLEDLAHLIAGGKGLAMLDPQFIAAIRHATLLVVTVLREQDLALRKLGIENARLSVRVEALLSDAKG